MLHSVQCETPGACYSPCPGWQWCLFHPSICYTIRQSHIALLLHLYMSNPAGCPYLSLL